MDCQSSFPSCAVLTLFTKMAINSSHSLTISVILFGSHRGFRSMILSQMSSFPEFLQSNLHLVEKIPSRFCALSFAVIRSGRRARPNKLSGNMIPSLRVRQSLNNIDHANSKVNQPIFKITGFHHFFTSKSRMQFRTPQLQQSTINNHQSTIATIDNR